MSALELRVIGRPAPQGSKKFAGMRGGRPVLVEQSKYVGPWRKAVADATTMAMRMNGGICDWPLTCPVSVYVSLYLPHAPSNRDPVPSGHGAGDLDKHFRSILDALVAAGALADDALVVRLTGIKGWAAPGLQHPGAYIRIDLLES